MEGIGNRSIFCMLGCVGTYLRKEMGSIMGRIGRMQSRDFWAAGLPPTKALYSAASCCASWLSRVYSNVFFQLHHISIFCMLVWVEQKPPGKWKKSTLHWCPLDVSGVHFDVLWNFVVYTLERVPLSTWVGQRRNHLIRYAIETDGHTEWSSQ